MRFNATFDTIQRSALACAPSPPAICGGLLIAIAVAVCSLPLAAAPQQSDSSTADEAGAPADGAGAGDFPPAISLLSNKTQGMVEVDQLPELLEQWSKTSLSELQREPAMQKFLESQRDKIAARLAELGLRSGIRLRDLRDAVSGELVFAWMQFDAPQRPYSIAILADTRGRDTQRASMLKKLDQELRQRGAKLTNEDVRGQNALVYTMPQKKGQLVIERLVIVELAGRLIISDRLETVRSLVDAALDGSPGGLMQAEDFESVFAQVRESHAEGETVDASLPRVRWFARPIGMGMIARELAGVDRGRKVDVLKLLRDQGFDAIRAAGGEIHLATEHYDVLHQSFIFAPPTVESPERYKLAARMLQFPNAPMADPPDWVLSTAATLLHARWKMEEAFWATESLVNEAMGDEVFGPTLEGIKEDESGPHIDVANDVVANFQEDFYIMTDNQVTPQGTQERVVGAIHVKNPQQLAKVLGEAMEREPNVFRFPYEPHVVWEVRPEETADIDFDVSGVEDFGLETDLDEEQEKSEALLEKWAITVFDGYLMFASHADLLVDLIEKQKQGGPGLAADPTYDRVRVAIFREGGESNAIHRVIRTDLAWRVKYELLRQGRFLESDSLLATLIRRAKERAEKAQSADRDVEEIDLSQLPPFADIRRHLQPGGGFLETREQGWSSTHFLLRKE